jgi:hypothetical protein
MMFFNMNVIMACLMFAFLNEADGTMLKKSRRVDVGRRMNMNPV